MVKFTGGWGVVERFVQRVRLGVMTSETKASADTLGEAIADKVRNHIRTADLPWKALAPITVSRKGHSRPYIDTLAYLQSIDVRVERPHRFALKIEVYPQGNHPGGMKMADLALILEGMRPLWGPTFEEVKDMQQFKEFKKAGAFLGFSR